jgi:hypothetical protein
VQRIACSASRAAHRVQRIACSASRAAHQRNRVQRIACSASRAAHRVQRIACSASRAAHRVQRTKIATNLSSCQVNLSRQLGSMTLGSCTLYIYTIQITVPRLADGRAAAAPVCVTGGHPRRAGGEQSRAWADCERWQWLLKRAMPPCQEVEAAPPHPCCSHAGDDVVDASREDIPTLVHIEWDGEVIFGSVFESM